MTAISKKTVLMALVLVFLLSATLGARLTASTTVASAEREAGVKVGDWVKYNLIVTWTSDVPNATEPPHEVLEINQTEWIKNTVLGVSGSNITFQMVAHYKNDTETTTVEYVDLETGESSPTGTLMFIPSNLAEKDIIYASPTEDYYINETVVRKYMGVTRETNLLNVTTIYVDEPYYTIISAKYYWDKATGVLCERPGATLTYTEGYLTSVGISEKIVDTNLWEPDISPVAEAGEDQIVVEDTIVTFDGSASYDPDGTIAIYDWDFGDGNVITETDPITTHTYENAGTYIVTLTVRDAADNSDTDEMTVTVEESSASSLLGSVIVIGVLLGLLFLWIIRTKK